MCAPFDSLFFGQAAIFPKLPYAAFQTIRGSAKGGGRRIATRPIIPDNPLPLPLKFASCRPGGGPLECPREGAAGRPARFGPGPKAMLFRFSLYGFLKNQTYFEPFLILAFREKGLSFFQIGLLIGFREVCVNLFEVPSGAVADLYGRRRAMIFSFLAYIASFLLFGFAAHRPFPLHPL